MKRTLTIAAAILLTAFELGAQTREDYRVPRAAVPPAIDGVLDDEVWKQAPLPSGDWVSYNPLRGDNMSPALRTEVRIAYDDRNLYFAFHCFDNEPDKIRTTISRRDNAFNDDWIAMSLDSAGTGQTAYHLFVNPERHPDGCARTRRPPASSSTPISCGTASGKVTERRLRGGSAAAAPDDPVLGRRPTSGWAWCSSARSAAWACRIPGPKCRRACGCSTSRRTFASTTLHQPRLMELLPSVTYGVSQTRATPEQWNPADRKPETRA